MSKRASRESKTPLILGLVVTAIVVVGFLLGTREPTPPPRPEPPVQLDFWKCLACIKVPGKSWGACRTVMGKGDEIGARRFAKKRACEANKVPLDTCEVENLTCTKLEGAQAVKARPKVRVTEPEE